MPNYKWKPDFKVHIIVIVRAWYLKINIRFKLFNMLAMGCFARVRLQWCDKGPNWVFKNMWAELGLWVLAVVFGYGVVKEWRGCDVLAKEMKLTWWWFGGRLMVAIGGFGWCGRVRWGVADVNMKKEKEKENRRR